MEVKFIKIFPETHRKLKVQAAQKGMTLKEYVKYLADKEETNDIR